MKKESKKKLGFTLPEVLITLAIIGVVAAMTIPTLSKNIQEREFLIAHKRINSMITNAITFINANDGIKNATDAEDFVTNYLSKYLRITTMCGYENHQKCGFNTDTNGINRIDEVKMTLPTTMDELQKDLQLKDIERRGYSFLTSNGYSMMLFYNPNCKSDSKVAHYVQNMVCANIVWDMNGLAEPNTVAKDIGFTTIFYPTYSNIVTPKADPSPSNVRATFDNTANACKTYAGEEYKVPTRDELASLYFNGRLINQTNGNFWSSEAVSGELGWHQNFYNGYRYHYNRSYSYLVRCVRR